MSMNAVVYHKFGNPTEVVHKEQVPIPEIGETDVLVKSILCAIHNHNYVTIVGSYGHKPQLPHVDGSEGYGIVEKVGSKVTNLKVGQKISTARAKTGTWAEYFVADAASAIPVPDSIDDETAAQLSSMPLSAYLLVDFIGVKKGDWFAYNGANGVVGKVIAAIAKSRGINMLKIVRRESAKKELEDLGFDSIVVYGTDHWKEDVKKIVGDAPIIAAVDNIGGKDAADLLRLTYEKGVLTLFGRVGKDDMPLNSGDLIFSQRKIQGFWATHVIPTLPKETIYKHIKDVVTLFATGTLKLPAGGVYSFDEAGKALAATVSEKSGKILFKPN